MSISKRIISFITAIALAITIIPITSSEVAKAANIELYMGEIKYSTNARTDETSTENAKYYGQILNNGATQNVWWAYYDKSKELVVGNYSSDQAQAVIDGSYESICNNTFVDTTGAIDAGSLSQLYAYQTLQSQISQATTIKLFGNIKSIAGKENTAMLWNNNSNATKIYLPCELETIGEYAFDGLSALKDIYFVSLDKGTRNIYTDYTNSKLSTLKEHSFKNCSSLTKFTLPNLGTFPSTAFSGNTKLKEVKILKCSNTPVVTGTLPSLISVKTPLKENVWNNYLSSYPAVKEMFDGLIYEQIVLPKANTRYFCIDNGTAKPISSLLTAGMDATYKVEFIPVSSGKWSDSVKPVYTYENGYIKKIHKEGYYNGVRYEDCYIIITVDDNATLTFVPTSDSTYDSSAAFSFTFKGETYSLSNLYLDNNNAVVEDLYAGKVGTTAVYATPEISSTSQIGNGNPKEASFIDDTVKTAIFYGNINEISENEINNSNISNVYLTERIEIIGNDAFSYMKNLESVQFISCKDNSASIVSSRAANTSIYRIGKRAFKEDTKLKQIYLPEVNTIDEEAFMSTGLNTISMVAISSIRANAFKNTMLKNVYGSMTSQDFAMIGGIVEGTGNEKFLEATYKKLDTIVYKIKSAKLEEGELFEIIDENFIYSETKKSVTKTPTYTLKLVIENQYKNVTLDDTHKLTCTLSGNLVKAVHKEGFSNGITYYPCKLVIDEVDEYENHVGTTTTVSLTVNSKCVHQYVQSFVENPTCTKDGYKLETCSICNKERKTVLKALGHSYKEVMTTPASTLSDGVITKICSTCLCEGGTIAIPKIKSIVLSTSQYTYNNKAKKPTITVKDRTGKVLTNCYTLRYSSNINPGFATCIVTFKGNYTGTERIKFKISPKKPTIKSLKNEKSRFQLKVKSSSERITGYEIQYSTSKKFTKKTTYKTKKRYYLATSYYVSIKKKYPKKTYYVRVRAYYQTANGTIYSPYSSVKTVKKK